MRVVPPSCSARWAREKLEGARRAAARMVDPLWELAAVDPLWELAAHATGCGKVDPLWELAVHLL